MTEIVLAFIGLLIAAMTIAALLWSIAQPKHRLWPPHLYGFWTPVIVWVPTFTLSGIIIVLGILEWGEINIPILIRYGLGISLIIISNLAVWYEVKNFGIEKTGGAKGTLKTNGLYKYSRNPQYLADITMIFGWMILSASPTASIVGFTGIITLFIAPFAEEPWLKEVYGERYIEYTRKVPRFF